MTIGELVEAQCAWLDTSQLPRTNKRAMIEPLALSLAHIKACTLDRGTCIAALCGKLLKLWETYGPPVAVGDEQEVGARIQAYVEMIYHHFDEEWSGSLAYLTHRAEALQDGYHFALLERRGEKRGGSGRGQGRKPQNGVAMTAKVIDFPQKLIDQLQAEASEQGVSFAQVVRDRIEKSYE